MSIKAGSTFAVTRGFLINTSGFDFMFGGGPRGNCYDRSHEGYIYEALEVCGPVIAAKVVRAKDSPYANRVGAVVQINTTELEVCEVSEALLSALNSSTEEASEV